MRTIPTLAIGLTFLLLLAACVTRSSPRTRSGC